VGEDPFEKHIRHLVNESPGDESPVRDSPSEGYILDCGLEFTPRPFRVSTRRPALRIGPSR
jgi:hypothetical protein